MTKTKSLSKKEFKKMINELGGFTPSSIDKCENKFPAKAETIIRERYSKEQAEDILVNAVYIETVSSDGDLNRNGYIIRANAWKSKGTDGKDAITRYMENPVVLLQHENEEIIGNTLWAKVTSNELRTGCYVFPDQMNEADQKRFKRGQLKAISTGHITLAVEWENAETGEVMDDETAQKEIGFWELLFNPIWLMAVTGLDWVEQSLVSIGSNKSSFVKNDANGNPVMISSETAKMNWFKNQCGEDVSKAERYMELKANPSSENKAELEKLHLELFPNKSDDLTKTPKKEENETAMKKHTLTENDFSDPKEAAKWSALGLKVGDVFEYPINESEVEETPATVEDNPASEVTHAPEGTETPEEVETPEDVTPNEEGDDQPTPSTDDPEKNEVVETPTPVENTETVIEEDESADPVENTEEGEPGDVPSNASREQLENGAKVLTEALNKIQAALEKKNAVKKEEPTTEVVENKPTPTEENTVEKVQNEIIEALRDNGFNGLADEIGENGLSVLPKVMNDLSKKVGDLKNLFDNMPNKRSLSVVNRDGNLSPKTVNGKAPRGAMLKKAFGKSNLGHLLKD